MIATFARGIDEQLSLKTDDVYAVMNPEERAKSIWAGLKVPEQLYENHFG